MRARIYIFFNGFLNKVNEKLTRNH